MFLRGQVVRSLAGRDKNYLMAVIECDKKYVYVSDGKERPLGRPKRKNPIHISLTDCVLTNAQMQSDKRLRKALREIEFKNNNGGNPDGKAR